MYAKTMPYEDRYKALTIKGGFLRHVAALGLVLNKINTRIEVSQKNLAKKRPESYNKKVKQEDPHDDKQALNKKSRAKIDT